MYANTILALCGLASVASAHMKMNKPVPYGASSLDNSPLDKTGSDFPCKQRSGVYDAQGASNVYALGSSGTLAFTGQATHGGGSCQVSITYDANPTKNSVFKVIQSIEGGCPAKDQTGNMGGDANALDPYTYGFKIPDNIPAGNGTIVWTWFNKVGNREMYMNCGPLTLTGTGGSKSNFDALPDMFTANIGNGCSTPDSTDLVFPNPGAAVDKFNGATTAWGTPQGTCQTAGPAASPAAGSNTPTTAAAQPTAPAASVPGGVFVTVPVASDTPAATPSATADPSPVATSAAAKSPSPAVTPTPIASPAPAASSSPSSGTGSTGAMTAGTSCSTEGSWNCVGGSQYQRCASGMWSVLMPLAAGTSCTPGQSANINMVVTRQGKKRTLRFRSF